MIEDETPATKVERLAGGKLNASVVLAFLGLTFQAGIYFGAIQPIPAKLEGVSLQISTLVAKLNDLDSNQKMSAKDLGALTGRVGTIEAENARQWEIIRLTQSMAENSVNKEDFSEWRVQLERINKNVVTPSLAETNKP